MTINQGEKSRQEDNAKEALPLIFIEPHTETVGSAKTNVSVFDQPRGGLIKIWNVGKRELYDLRLIKIKINHLGEELVNEAISPILYKGCSTVTSLHHLVESVMTNRKNKNEKNNSLKMMGEFTFSYQDCYENLYEQDFGIYFDCQSMHVQFDDGDEVFRYYTANRCEVIGAPKLQKII